jgi:predicted transcriptional regulator
MSSTRETEDKKLEKVMNKLEKEGMANVKELKKKEGLIPIEESLMNLMQKGADEFEKEMGRKMNYGEMREMYG